VPEPVGVVATIAPSEPSLEGIVSRILPAVVSGNTVVAVASQNSPLAAIELAEAFATSDLPGGAVNILTGDAAELGPVLAGHMDVNALDLTGADGDTTELERLTAGNVKRIVRGAESGESLWEIAPPLELKTVWHPIGT
jgi:acyl-CoA reductase-like NAD-dependent aldehyde dehydrogenase